MPLLYLGDQLGDAADLAGLVPLEPLRDLGDQLTAYRLVGWALAEIDENVLHAALEFVGIAPSPG